MVGWTDGAVFVVHRYRAYLNCKMMVPLWHMNICDISEYRVEILSDNQYHLAVFLSVLCCRENT